MSAFILDKTFIAVLAVLAAAAASVLKKWIEETFRTRRLMKSIEGAPPRRRPEIILACSRLECRTQQSEQAGNDTNAPAAHPPSPEDDHNTRHLGR